MPTPKLRMMYEGGVIAPTRGTICKPPPFHLPGGGPPLASVLPGNSLRAAELLLVRAGRHVTGIFPTRKALAGVRRLDKVRFKVQHGPFSGHLSSGCIMALRLWNAHP